MQTYGVTSFIGGVAPGSYLSDVHYMSHDGQYVLRDVASSILNTVHPIHQITASSGWVVDGVSITYDLANGDTATMNHGTSFNPPAGVVSFGQNEILTAVYGREGCHSYYNRNLVTNITFVIFDTNTEQSRTAGGADFVLLNIRSGTGTVLTKGSRSGASDVLALGSFAQNTLSVGLSGLFFKDSSNSTNKALNPSSNLNSAD